MPISLPETRAALSEPALPLARYRLRFERRGPGGLPAFTGSAWHGALGHALKRLAAPADYTAIFETPVTASAVKLRAYQEAPRPFAMAPVGDGIELSLTLFGHGQRHARLMTQALQAAGEGGLGAAGTRLRLCAVERESPVGSGGWRPAWFPAQPEDAAELSPAAWPATPIRVQVNLLTPLRLRRLDIYLKPQQFRFAVLFGNLLRRISLLTAFYAPEPLETDFRGLLRTAASVGLEQPELRWQDWSRYSSRQEKLIAMGGLLGAFGLELAGSAELWPYLWLGQFTQAGKGTSMGLGQYTVGAQ